MPITTPWENLIRLILNGEAVSAPVTNRPLSGLASRTQYLYEQLQLLSAGEALFAHNVPIEDVAVPGDAVYFDYGTATYKRALAAAELDPVHGWYTTAPSSYVVGLVYSKTGTGIGSIVTMGMLRSFDLSAAIEGGNPAVPGPYYLSMHSPGKLIDSKPAVGVYVLYNRGDGTAHILPTPKDVLESHIHYKFQLYAQPAGDHNCIEYDDGQYHKVVNPDVNLPGWLPADHPSFLGLAPAGAKFGYNMAMHPELLRVWPPVPRDTAYLEVNSHSVEVTDGRCPVAIVDVHGLWWMQDCYGMAPWAPQYPGCILESSSSSSSSSEECCITPLEYLPGHGQSFLDEKTITLWFAKMSVKTDEAVVTSLSPRTAASPIAVLNCDGQPASTGQLNLSVDFSKLAVVDPSVGYKAVKGFGLDQLLRGPVITGLKPTSDIALQPIGTLGVDYEVDANGIYHGQFTIGLANLINEPKEGAPDLTIVSNVREQYDDVLKLFYLHFPAGMTSEIRGRVEIPRIAMPTSAFHMNLWFWFVGRSAGAMPLLTATYRRLTRPTTVQALPVSDTDIVGGGWTPGLTLAASQYGEATTPFFNVAAGETVFFSIGWGGSGGPADGFGLIRAGWHIEVI